MAKSISTELIPSLYDMESDLKKPSSKRPRLAVALSATERWTPHQTSVLIKTLNEHPTWTAHQIMANVPDLQGRTPSSVAGKISRLRRSGKVSPRQSSSKASPDPLLIGMLFVA